MFSPCAATVTSAISNPPSSNPIPWARSPPDSHFNEPPFYFSLIFRH